MCVGVWVKRSWKWEQKKRQFRQINVFVSITTCCIRQKITLFDRDFRFSLTVSSHSLSLTLTLIFTIVMEILILLPFRKANIQRQHTIKKIGREKRDKNFWMNDLLSQSRKDYGLCCMMAVISWLAIFFCFATFSISIITKPFFYLLNKINHSHKSNFNFLSQNLFSHQKMSH